MRIAGILATIILLASCVEKQSNEGHWIKGSEQQQLDMVEKQFRGFDQAMFEIGYRYQELYWGGQDENWAYADYQLQKIEKALVLAMERRPKRAANAQLFLKSAVPQMKGLIAAKDKELFESRFVAFQKACNACHIAEKLPFFKVGIPQGRQSPIGNLKSN